MHTYASFRSHSWHWSQTTQDTSQYFSLVAHVAEAEGAGLVEMGRELNNVICICSLSLLTLGILKKLCLNNSIQHFGLEETSQVFCEGD